MVHSRRGGLVTTEVCGGVEEPRRPRRLPPPRLACNLSVPSSVDTVLMVKQGTGTLMSLGLGRVGETTCLAVSSLVQRRVS